jgi:hypothetical protein
MNIVQSDARKGQGAELGSGAPRRRPERAFSVLGQSPLGIEFAGPHVGLLAKADISPSAAAAPVLKVTNHKGQFTIRVNVAVLGITEPMVSRIFSLDGSRVVSLPVILDLGSGNENHRGRF